MAFLCHDDKDKSLMGAPRASKFLNKEKEKLHEMISGEHEYKEHLQKVQDGKLMQKDPNSSMNQH